MKRRVLLGVCTAAVVILAAAIVVCVFFKPRLVVSRADTGEILASYPLPSHKRFDVIFTHSVNKSIVYDRYEVRGNGDIYITETWYYSFGAGVQSELNPGESLEYGDDGSMRVTNINKRIDDLVYSISSVSDHVLMIGGGDISLCDTFGDNITLRFYVR